MQPKPRRKKKTTARPARRRPNESSPSAETVIEQALRMGSSTFEDCVDANKEIDEVERRLLKTFTPQELEAISPYVDWLQPVRLAGAAKWIRASGVRNPERATARYFREYLTSNHEGVKREVDRVKQRLGEILDLEPALASLASAAHVDLDKRTKAAIGSVFRASSPRPKSPVTACLKALDVLSFVGRTLEFGADDDWVLLRKLCDLIAEDPVDRKRAFVVSSVDVAIRDLYRGRPARKVASTIIVDGDENDRAIDDLRASAKRPGRSVSVKIVDGWVIAEVFADPTPAPDPASVSLEDVESAADGIVESILENTRWGAVTFPKLEHAFLVPLLERASPRFKKALGAPYIAAAMSLHAGAFGDVAEPGEPEEEARRRLSNIFRNAWNRERTRQEAK